MNLKKALLLSGCVLALAGCSTGSTTIPDSSEVLMTVGNKTVTKGSEYTMMKESSGPQTALNLANKLICSKEIGESDELKQKAQKTLDQYAQNEGFDEQLKTLGYDSREDYLNDVLIPTLQADELKKKYFTDAKEDIITEFDPVLAVIIQTDSEDNATKALDALKNGDDPGKVGAQYAPEDATYTGSEQIITTLDTDLPTTLLNAIQDASKEGVLDEVYTNDTSTDNKEYYVAKVVSTDYDKNLSKIQDALLSNQTISNDSQVYYLKKYKFEVHDQYIFDYFKATNPEYLVTRPDLSESTSEK